MPPKAQKVEQYAPAARSPLRREAVDRRTTASKRVKTEPMTASTLLSTPRKVLKFMPSLPLAQLPGAQSRWPTPRPQPGTGTVKAPKISQQRMSYMHHPITRSLRPVRILAPNVNPDEPIRLPDPPSLPAPPQYEEDNEQEEMDMKKEPEETSSPNIKLRDGWGYKIGQTNWRAVYDPKRKSIPKLPLRGPGGYSVSTTPAGKNSPSKPSVFLVVHPLEDAPIEAPKEPSLEQPQMKKVDFPRRKRGKLHIIERDRGAAEAVKRCFDERMAEDTSSTSPHVGALIKITSTEKVQQPHEHLYLRPEYVHSAEIVTTFPAEEVVHYQNKKYKDDHVVINSSDLEEIYEMVKKIRTNKRNWARAKARAAVDEEYRVHQAARKARAREAEKAKFAAMSYEEKHEKNKRKYQTVKAKRMAMNPDRMTRKQLQHERRQANLPKLKALLAAGIDNPEEKRRVQRRIKAASMTLEERLKYEEKQKEYSVRKRERMMNSTAEELAEWQESKRLKLEKKAALAALTPKERARVQQREYEARYKEKRKTLVGESWTSSKSASPLKGARKRKVKIEEEEEEVEVCVLDEEETMEKEEGILEEEIEVEEVNVVDDDYEFFDNAIDEFEENQMAAEAIESPSPSHPSREIPRPSHHSHSYPHHNYGFMRAGPSSSRYNQQRYGRDIETELLQLQKEYSRSDSAIHNSRVEVERLRREADDMESAIDRELQIQRGRKRRINQLNAIWSEDHGEDSQG